MARLLRPLLSDQISKFTGASLCAAADVYCAAQRELVLAQADQRKIRGHPCGEFQPLGGRTASLLRPLLSDQSSKFCRRHPRGEFLPLGRRIARQNDWISSTDMSAFECLCILSPLSSLLSLSLSLASLSLCIFYICV